MCLYWAFDLHGGYNYELHLRGGTYVVVTTTIRPSFDSHSTAIDHYDNLHYDCKPICVWAVAVRHV